MAEKETAVKTAEKKTNSKTAYYIVNESAKKFHKPACRWVKKMRASNKRKEKDRGALIKQGYSPCKVCNP